LLIVCLVEWMAPFGTIFITAFALFMGQAFYETRTDYMNMARQCEGGQFREVGGTCGARYEGKRQRPFSSLHFKIKVRHVSSRDFERDNRYSLFDT
jgi:hypothetical protein